MRREQFQEIKRLFLELRDESLERRRQRIDEIEQRDATLSSAVERLLALDGIPDDELDAPALGNGFRLPDAETLAHEDETDRAGWRIGNYRLERVLGRGGMGLVYLAEQLHPRRKVALKVLRSIDPSPESLLRFQHESQALGRLQHPSVAQIFEAGAARSPAGRQPFLAMELVDGRPLLDHADRAGLDLDARVELLADICQAVQHAHERGVLHCDLKPENLLVDRDRRPKVIDFGIAQLTRAVGEVPEAGLGGTLAYMSPELHPGSLQTPDRRADVFSMGRVMARLLWAVEPPELPAENRSLPVLEGDPRGELVSIVDRATRLHRDERYASMQELEDDLRRFADQRPVRARDGGWLYRAGCLLRRRRGSFAAGTAVAATLALAFFTASTLGRETRSARASANREAERTARVADFLTSVLSTADALEYGPEATLADLLEKVGKEVHAVFADEPDLEATVRVTLASVHRRNGHWEAAEREARAALAVGAELGPTHPVTLRAMNLLAAVTLASGQTAEAEELLRELLARTSNAGIPEPADGRPPEILLAHAMVFDGRLPEAEMVLHQYVQGVSDSPGAEPYARRAEAELLYLNQGHGSAADLERLLRESFESSTRVLGPAHAETLAAQNDLGHLLVQDGARLSEGLAVLEDAYSTCLEVYGGEHADTLSIQHNLACAHGAHGDWETAVEIATEVLEGRLRTLGEEHPNTLLSAHNLAQFEHRSGAWEEALERAEELAAAVRAHLPEGHLYHGMFAATHGEMLRHRLRLDEAEERLRQAVADIEQAITYPTGKMLLSANLRGQLMNARTQLGLTLFEREDFESARAIFESVFEERVEAFGMEHPRTLSSAQNLATAWGKLGLLERAEAMLRTVLQQRSALLGEAHPSSLRTRQNLANVLERNGRRQEALSESRKVVELALTHPAGTLSELGLYQGHLGLLLRSFNELEEAERLCRQALESHDLNPGADHPGRGRLLSQLGVVLNTQRNFESARDVMREAHRICSETFGEQHSLMLELDNNLAAALVETGDHEEAGVLFARTLRQRQERYGPAHERTLIALNNYAYWLRRGGDYEQALALNEQLLETAREVLPPGGWRVPGFEANYGYCLMLAGRLEEARSILERSVLALVQRLGTDDKRTKPCLRYLETLYTKLELEPEEALETLIAEGRR